MWRDLLGHFARAGARLFPASGKPPEKRPGHDPVRWEYRRGRPGKAANCRAFERARHGRLSRAARGAASAPSRPDGSLPVMQFPECAARHLLNPGSYRTPVLFCSLPNWPWRTWNIRCRRVGTAGDTSANCANSLPQQAESERLPHGHRSVTGRTSSACGACPALRAVGLPARRAQARLRDATHAGRRPRLCVLFNCAAEHGSSGAQLLKSRRSPAGGGVRPS